jgi:hypothetical protein
MTGCDSDGVVQRQLITTTVPDVPGEDTTEYPPGDPWLVSGPPVEVHEDAGLDGGANDGTGEGATDSDASDATSDDADASYADVSEGG